MPERPFNSVPALPIDVLRLIFEQAAYGDRKIALKLVLICPAVQKWIDFILYSVVNLHRERTSRLFLRTIETSRTKSLNFFAMSVKCLCISYKICDARTIKIILACRGITNLTFWAVPSFTERSTFNQTDASFYAYADTPTFHYSTQGPRMSFPEGYSPNPVTTSAINEALNLLRPLRLSLLFDSSLGSPIEPYFHLSFFSCITHLTIVNRWEDWSNWSGFESLTSLTNLSFDLNVRDGLTLGAANYIVSPRNEDTRQTRCVQKLADMLMDVLERCKQLKVCVVLLLFSPNPEWIFRSILHSIVNRKWAINSVPVSDATKSSFDPRLVFARYREPFRDREAHASKQMVLWKRVEQTVESQRVTSGPIILEA